MPYRRSSRRPRVKRRAVRRRLRSRVTRRSRPIRRRRTMTRKRILNVTSHKRSDAMLTFSNTLPTGAVNATSINALYVLGNRTAFSLWCATARTLGNAAQSTPVFADDSDRMSQTCYMRGLKENVNIQTNSGLPWQWRRICFKIRGGLAGFYTTVPSDSPTQAWQPYADSSVGMGRLWFDENLNTQPATLTQQQAYIFKGQANQDWQGLITAPLDTTRIDVAYDRTINIASGNTVGTLREHKLWHPMNKNLCYNDDEQGITQAGSYFSVPDKRGMGDYFICDIFQPASFGTNQDILAVSSNSRLYWHEK